MTNNACFAYNLETRNSFLLEIHPCPPVHQSRVKPGRLEVSVDFRFHSVRSTSDGQQVMRNTSVLVLLGKVKGSCGSRDGQLRFTVIRS